MWQSVAIPDRGCLSTKLRRQWREQCQRAGAAYVFTRSGTTWTLEQKLVGSGTNARNADDEFGWRRHRR